VGQNAAGIFLAVYPIVAYIYFMWSSTRLTISVHAPRQRLTLIILAGTLIFVLALLVLGFKEDQLIVTGSTMEISGLYGEKLELNDILSIELVQHVPPIKMKTNGFALGTINKGYFKTVDGQVVKLIMNSNATPCILILKSDGKRIYFSSKSIPNSKLFESLKQALPER
jgi:hypothetical protein